MRNFLILTSVLLFVLPVYGIEECSTGNPCEFLRGDVDCDGDVDANDLTDLVNGNYSNEDAADVNDNGVVEDGQTGADSVRLANYIVYHVQPPEEPFTNPGLDCTADFLENCCSPWLGAVTEQYTYDIDRGFYSFDYASTGTPLTVQSSDCSVLTSQTAVYDLEFNVTDNRQPTVLKLENGYIDIDAEIFLSFEFSHGYGCGPCTAKTNSMSVDFSSAFVYIDYGVLPQPGTPYPDSVYISPANCPFTGSDVTAEKMTYTYSRAAGTCVITPGTQEKTVQLNIDNIQDLLANDTRASGCDEIQIQKISIFNVSFKYSPLGQSIANGGQIQQTEAALDFNIDECVE